MELAAYVAKRSHIGSASQLTLLESAPANDACYWRLRYRDSASKNELTFYLTPDGKYLLPALYDLSVDPLVEQKAAAEKLMKTLLVDGPPSRGAAGRHHYHRRVLGFECPFCKRMTDVLDALRRKTQGHPRRVPQLPVANAPSAKDAAEVAGCAALQSDAAFWKVHDYLFNRTRPR